MDKEWVEQNLDRLARALDESVPLYCTREFEPTKKFYDSLFQASEFSFIVKQLSSYINLPTIPDIEVVGDSEIPVLDLQSGLRFFDKVIDSAGDYSSRMPFAPKIRIGASHFRNVYVLGRILAHEMAHHFLHLRLIRSVAEDEDEMFTDLSAIYLGFGKLMLNSATGEPPESILRPVYLSEKGVPYLGYPLLAYSYCLCQTKRSINRHAIYQNLKEPCASMVKAFVYQQGKNRTFLVRLLEFLGFIPRLPDTDGRQTVKETWRLDEQRYRIVDCIGCGAHLKIPKTEKALELRCPKCKKEFQVKIHYK